MKLHTCIQKIKGKGIKPFLLAYIIFALVGSSIISMGEAFFVKYSNNDNLNSKYLSSIDHSIDWLAAIKIKKIGSNSNSPLRNRLLRVFTFSGAIAIIVYLLNKNLKTNNDNITTINNPVLLKLRI